MAIEWSEFILWEANKDPGIVYFTRDRMAELYVNNGRHLALKHYGFELTTHYTPIVTLREDDYWGSGLLKNWQEFDSEKSYKDWTSLQADLSRGNNSYNNGFTGLIYWLFDNCSYDFTMNYEVGRSNVIMLFSNKEDAMAFKLRWL